jgi:hypothetical protein
MRGPSRHPDPLVPGLCPELGVLLARLRLGDPIELDDLVVVPLLGADLEVEADLLEEGLAGRATEIAEVDEHGDVNTVKVTHRGHRPLLLIDGEELVGAKQNRVLNASFLVGPGTTVLLPVSCVERGRWSARTAAFASSSRTLSSPARTSKLRRVARSVTSSGSYDSDQGAVWADAPFPRPATVGGPSSLARMADGD